jgi:hypothetical protein
MFQANSGNVREFKLAMKTLKAERMANFSVALTEAFKSFNKVRKCLCKSKKRITLCFSQMQQY